MEKSGTAVSLQHGLLLKKSVSIELLRDLYAASKVR